MSNASGASCKGSMRLRQSIAAVCVVLTLCFAIGADAQPMSRAQARQRADALAALGGAMFTDPRLSASGRLACASCHSPDHAFGPPNALAVQLGGRDMRQPGVRAAPSLTYLQAVPQFTEHFFESEDEADESIDNGPTGGLTWDGRVDTAQEQARIPLLSPFEMGNDGPNDVVRRAVAAGYGERLAALGAPDPGGHQVRAFATVLKALAVFQQDWRSFYPYSSKFDAYLAGKAALTPLEQQGLTLFKARDKGNCASCHISDRAADGTPPQFTDYGMIALGVPRNPAIPANADPAYYDLGLCGPLRTDFTKRSDYCGRFRTPSLRNVATRQVFFHNGVFHSLRDAVAFYATRDSDPGRWYPKHADGTVAKFDDLPPADRANVNMDPPFGASAGGRPALTDPETDAIVAFLKTLTDGWKPGANSVAAR